MRKFWFFDLDGTLADTDRDIREAWKAALRDLGLDCPRFDEVFVAGPPIDEMTRRLFPDRFTPALADDVRRLFALHYDNDGFPATREYPRVFDRVKALRAAGAKVFIVTNKRMAGTKAMAARFCWDRVFDGVYSGDMYAADPSIGKLRKPALLSRVISGLGAAKDECVMVGDTANDFEAAAENGIESVAVAWGYGTPAERSCADRIASTPEEI